MYEYKAKVIKIVDGDTMDVDIDVGFKIHFIERIRLFGINTPETYGVKHNSEEYAKGIKSKEWAIKNLEGKEITIKTIKDKKGKYGRYLAIIIKDEININNKMVELGLAKKHIY